jgi:exodeoxyribonuclease III
VLLATWNVNSLKVRLPRVLEFLELHRPDIVCLQETKLAPDAFPEAELAEAGYAATHHSGGRWAGVAILTRQSLEPQAAHAGLPGEADPTEARWCEVSAGGLRVASVYVPNGRTLDSPEYPRKLAFLDAMVTRARSAAAAGEPLLIAGDFNIAPADIDVYDPLAFAGGTHVSGPERERLAQMLDAELIDAYRHLFPEEVGYTWWDYRQGHFHRKLGLRIDLWLVPTGLAPRLVRCGIDRNFRKGQKPSDHAPLLLELSEPLFSNA